MQALRAIVYSQGLKAISLPEARSWRSADMNTSWPRSSARPGSRTLARMNEWIRSR